MLEILRMTVVSFCIVCREKRCGLFLPFLGLGNEMRFEAVIRKMLKIENLRFFGTRERSVLLESEVYLLGCDFAKFLEFSKTREIEKKINCLKPLIL